MRVDRTTSFDLAEKKAHTEDKSFDTNSLPNKSANRKLPGNMIKTFYEYTQRGTKKQITRETKP